MNDCCPVSDMLPPLFTGLYYECCASGLEAGGVYSYFRHDVVLL